MRFKSVGECIYCGDHDSELTDEHIIPYGLGGNDVLPNASCKRCQQITSKFELEVLRNELIQVRTKLNMPSRKSSLPKVLPITVKIDEEWKTFYAPKADHPTFVVTLEYPLPGVFGGDFPKRGININGSSLIQIGGPPLKETLKSLGSSTIRVTYVSRGNEFERMLAKIAYGYAVAEYGLDAVRTSPLKTIILGDSDAVGYWIGMGNAHPQLEKKFRRVLLEKTEPGSWLFARIFLFQGMPEYIAVILEGDRQTKPRIIYTRSISQIDPQAQPHSDNIEITVRPIKHQN